MALLAAGQAACMTSPSPRVVARGDSPFGTIVTVRLLDGRRYEGELLAVHDSSLVVITADRIAVGRFADIARLDLAASSAALDGRGSALDVRTAAGYRRGQLASRFPFGMPAPALRALLDRSGQAAPDTLRVGAR